MSGLRSNSAGDTTDMPGSERDIASMRLIAVADPCRADALCSNCRLRSEGSFFTALAASAKIWAVVSFASAITSSGVCAAQRCPVQARCWTVAETKRILPRTRLAWAAPFATSPSAAALSAASLKAERKLALGWFTWEGMTVVEPGPARSSMAFNSSAGNSSSSITESSPTTETLR